MPCALVVWYTVGHAPLHGTIYRNESGRRAGGSQEEVGVLLQNSFSLLRLFFYPVDRFKTKDRVVTEEKIICSMKNKFEGVSKGL